VIDPRVKPLERFAVSDRVKPHLKTVPRRLYVHFRERHAFGINVDPDIAAQQKSGVSFENPLGYFTKRTLSGRVPQDRYSSRAQSGSGRSSHASRGSDGSGLARSRSSANSL
jgi:hypothetical protein